MKTLRIFTVAALAACLAACGGKTSDNASGADSVAVEDAVEAVAEIASAEDIQSPDQISGEIAKAVETGDQTKAQNLIAMVQQKIEELKAAGETAKVAEYAVKLKDLYEANKDKIKNIPGLEEAVGKAVTASGVAEAISALNAINPDMLPESAKAVIGDAKGKLDEKAGELRDKAKDKINEAVDKEVEKAKQKVKDDANKKLDDARKKLGF